MNSSFSKQKVKARGAEAFALIAGSGVSTASNMPMLNKISEDFSVGFPEEVRREVMINVEDHNVKTIRYNEINADNKEQKLSMAFKTNDYPMMVTVESKLAAKMLHIMLGGSGEGDDNYDKRTFNFTKCERNVIKSVFLHAVNSFVKAFNIVATISPNLEGSDVSHQSSMFLTRLTQVTVFTLDVSCGSTKGKISLMFPRVMLDPHKDILMTTAMDNGGDENLWSKKVHNVTKEAPVEVRGVVGSFNVTLEELMKWKSGIQFNIPQISNFSSKLMSGETVIATGRVGVVNGNMSILLSSMNDEDIEENENTVSTVAENKETELT